MDTVKETLTAPQKNVGKKRVISFIEKIPFWILATVLFLMPLLVFPNFISPTHFTKITLLYLGVFSATGFWLFNGLRKESLRFSKDGLFFALLAMLTVWFASSFFAADFHNSFFGKIGNIETLLTLLTMSLFMFLVSIFFKTEKRIFSFFSVLFVSSAIVSTYQFVHIIFGLDLLSLDALRPKTANLVGKWNDLSIFMGMIGVLALVFFSTFNFGKIVKTVLMSTIAVSVLSLIFTNFFLNWIIFGSVVLCVLIFTLLSSDKKNKFQKILTSGVLLAFVIFFIIFRGVSGNIVDLAGLDTFEARPNLSATANVVKNVFGGEKISALLGTGPNTFSNLWDKMKPVSVNQTVFWNTSFSSGVGHVPTLLATTGILGGLAILFFAFMFFKKSFSALRNGFSNENFLSSASKAAIFGAAYLWLMIVFYSPGFVALSLAFALTGIMLATRELLKNTPEHIFIFGGKKIGFMATILIVVAIIGLATAFYSQSLKFVASGYYGKGVKLFNINNDIDVAEKNLKKAVFFDKNQDEYLRAIAELGLIKLNSGMYKPGESEEETIKFGEELRLSIENAKSAVNAGNFNAANWMQLGNIYENAAAYGIENAEEMAMEAYRKAAEISLLNPNSFFSSARLKFLLGKNDEAKEYLNHAISLKPDFASALYLAAQIQIKEGNTKDAILSMTRAAIASPNDIGLHFQLGVLSYQNKDLETAKLAFERAVILNPVYANAKYFLGLIYDQQDRKEDALNQFLEILETNPGNKDVEKIIENIKNGKAALKGVEMSQDVNPPIPDKDDSKLEKAE